MKKTYNIFWKRNEFWSKVNNTPMLSDDADILVQTCKAAGVPSVTDIELMETETEPKEWRG